MSAGLSRRRFLAQGTLAASAFTLASPGVRRGLTAQERAPGDDEEIFHRVVRSVRSEAGAKAPAGVLVAACGRAFLGAPYVGHLLEGPPDERLVVNLRQFDCLLLVENALAIARTILLGSDSFDVFRAQLMLIRYREGIIRDYPSRLHYLTDWIADNAGKHVVEDITRALGGRRDSRVIRFMSTHTESYRQLSNPAYLEEIRRAEERLTGMERYVMPARSVAEVQDRLQDGDVVGTETSIEGLDFGHSGLVTVDGTARRLLHASMSGGKVEIAAGSLVDYLERHAISGIVVARPLGARR